MLGRGGGAIAWCTAVFGFVSFYAPFAYIVRRPV